MLKTLDLKELQARKAAAEEQFRGRKAGVDHHASIDPVTGRNIGGYVAGGIEAILVPYGEDLIPTYLQKIAEGYTPTPVGTVSVGATAFEIYMSRPEAQIKPLLDAILKKVEDDYKAEIEVHNEKFIQQQIDAQLRVDLAREERERAQAAAEKRALVEKQIRETFTVQPTPEPVKIPPARARR